MPESPTSMQEAEKIECTEKQPQITFEELFTLLLHPIRDQIRGLELNRAEDVNEKNPEAPSDQGDSKILELQALLTDARESQRILNHFVEKTTNQIFERLERLESQLTEKLVGIGNQVEELSKFPEPVVEQAVDVAAIILGKVLSESSQIETVRAELMSAIDEGNQAAQVLAGHILAARGSSAEQLSTLILEIGEALYLWRPKRAGFEDPFETELSRWVDQLCLQRGLPNSVGLVKLGEPFDSRRHISDQRGGYVTSVLGWIVLRDNGPTVYSRAKVQTG